ncbi:hypothetical protein [Corynebacterium sp.]|uniref:hypothetical protein n=1 Tax=Corynebacterium sp. TaxID=1720 RepID=UPI003B3B90A1
MIRIPVVRTVLSLGTGAALLVGASACSFETVFTTTEDDETAGRALALSAPGSADLWRTSGLGPDPLNDDAEPGTPMEFVDPVLLEDGELPPRMTATEAQALQVLQILADMVQDEGRRISEIATLRVYLSPENGDGDESAEGADFEGWNRAYRTFFANLDPLSGDSLLTGTSAVTLTAQTAPATSTTSEPSDDDGNTSASSASSPSGTAEPTDTTGDLDVLDDTDDEPYSGETNPTTPTVVTVGVAEQPVTGWLVQVEAEVLYDNE